MHGRKVVPAAEILRFCSIQNLYGCPDADADKSSEGIVLFEKVLRRKT